MLGTIGAENDVRCTALPAFWRPAWAHVKEMRPMLDMPQDPYDPAEDDPPEEDLDPVEFDPRSNFQREAKRFMEVVNDAVAYVERERGYTMTDDDRLRAVHEFFAWAAQYETPVDVEEGMRKFAHSDVPMEYFVHNIRDAVVEAWREAYKTEDWFGRAMRGNGHA